MADLKTRILHSARRRVTFLNHMEDRHERQRMKERRPPAKDTPEYEKRKRELFLDSLMPRRLQRHHRKVLQGELKGGDDVVRADDLSGESEYGPRTGINVIEVVPKTCHPAFEPLMRAMGLLK